MKRNIVILSICIIIISYIFAIPRFNDESMNRAQFFSYHQGILEDQHVITIEIQSNVNLKDFLISLDEAFVNNNLVAYKKMSGQLIDGIPNQTILYHTSNDTRITEHILLNDGYMDPALSGKYYSTFASEDELRISTFLSTDNLAIKNLQDDIEAGGFYYVGNLKGDVKINIDNFVKDIKGEYGKTSILIQQLEYDPISELNNMGLMGKRHRVMISLLLVVFLCGSIFTKIREIAIYKLEGRSVIELYTKYFEILFVRYMLLGFLLIIAINYFIFNKSLNSFMVLNQIVISEYIMISGGVQFFSLVLILIIICMPISVSIKGKNNLNTLQILVTTMKLCICIVWLPMISASLLNTIDTIQILYHYQDGINQFNNMYRITGSSSLDFINKNASYDAYRVEQQMFDNFNAFDFSGGYIANNNDESILYPVIFIDDRYIQLHDLLPRNTQLSDNTIYVFINEQNTLYPGYLKSFDQTVRALDDKNKVIWHTYNRYLPTYKVQDLAYNTEVSKNDILIFMNDGAHNSVAQHFIYSKDDINTTLTKMRGIFTDNGFECNFNLESMESFYAQSIKYRINYQLEILKSFLILFGCYLLINILLMDIDIANNKSRYFVTKIEGRFTYSFGVYVIKMALPTIIAFIIYNMKRKFIFDYNTINTLLVLIIVEALIFMIYNFHYKRKMREMK